jgi:hypothetical protein
VIGGGKGFGRDFFVSYCQSDRAWAEWIAWELESAGLRVLVQAWDSVPGTNWPALVADGVARGGRMVAVVSPSYLSSVVGTAEWQAVWAADASGQGRLLVPVRVAECGHRLLDTRTYIDLTGLAGTPGGSERARGLLLGGVQAAVAGRAKPPVSVPFPQRAVPHPPLSPWEEAARRAGGRPAARGRPVWREPLPELFVARPGPLGQVREMLMDPSCPRVVGLVGMGGAGKSTLARAAAADAPVQAEFADGIVWVDVGPAPDLPACQTRVLAAFGETEPVLDVPTGVERLRRLLDGARCLLVLDNVWDADHLRAFDVAGSVRLLVTTRSRDALFTTTYAVCELGPVDETTARRVLARYAHLPVDRLPEQAAAVIQRCGGLVLALAIVGGMVAEGRRWANVAERLARADLGKLAGRLPDYPHPDLLAALEASISALTAEQRARYVELAVFEGRGPVPLDVAADLWRVTGGVDALDGEDLLLLFGRRSLATVDPLSDTFTLHDLFFDYMRAGTGPEMLADLHARLADRALARWGRVEARLPGLSTCLFETPSDRYALRNTVVHLLAAGRDDDVHALLCIDWPTSAGRADNAWFTAHERAGLTAGYLADIRAAWRRAELATDTARDGGRPPAAIGLEVLYALIVGSIASIAGNVPPPLLLRLVEEDVWPVARALAYADAIPEPSARAGALGGLAHHLPEPERAQTLGRALDTAATIDDPSERARVLGVLAPLLPAELLIRARDTDASIDFPAGGVQALVELDSRLPEPEQSLTSDYDLDKAAAIHDSSERTRVLGALASRLPEPERSLALGRALAAAAAIATPSERARVLGVLAPLLPVQLLARARDTAATIDNPSGRVQALVELAPHLPAELVGRVLDSAAVVEDPSDRARALGVLAPHLPPRLVNRALDAAASIDDPYDRAQALAELVSRLPEPERAQTLNRALDAAASVEDPSSRARVLGGLAPYLPAQLVGRALDAAASVDQSSQARVLGALAPHLPAGLLGRALDTAASIDDPYDRAHALGALAPHLPAGLLGRALDTAASIDDPSERVRVLGELAPRLGESERTQMLRRALDVVAAIDNRSDRARSLGVLAAHLPAELLDRALDTAAGIENPLARTQALVALAHRNGQGPDRTDRFWRAAVVAASRASRRAVLTTVPHILVGESTEVGHLTVNAVDRVFRWWQ